MAIFFRFLIALVTTGVGILLITHSYQITQLFGHQEFAERYLGAGGTYTMWKLIGLILIFGAAWYLFK